MPGSPEALGVIVLINADRETWTKHAEQLTIYFHLAFPPGATGGSDINEISIFCCDYTSLMRGQESPLDLSAQMSRFSLIRRSCNF